MADYKGLNIRFSANTTDASKALHILGNEAKNAQGNLNRIQDALKNTKTNGDALNATLKQFQLEQLGKQADVALKKFEAYRDIVPQLTEKLAELRAERESTLSAMSGGEVKLFPDGTAMSMDELAAHLNAVEEEERKVAASVENATGNMNAQKSAAQALSQQYEMMSASLAASETNLGKFGANAQEFGTNLQSAGNALSSIGDKMTLVSGIAAMTFGRKIISSTEEFGNAISQLGGYLDIQGEQLNEMSDQALDWGKKTQFSATEAANAMNELAKGGMTQAQISGGAMKATMELAAAGSLDMAQAAEVAVQSIKTFGLSAEDSSAIADALAGAANKSTAEVTDLAQGFKYVGGWASMANWNINDVSGALALLSDHGLKSEMAGTALRNVMQRLAAPTSTASKLMNAYGFSVRDAQGHMVSAVEVVKRLNATFKDLPDAEKQSVLSNIFGARALPAAIALMDEGSDKLQEYIDATTEAGYAGEMAKNRMGDLGWALEYLRGEAETAAVNFGQALVPTIKDAAGAIENLLTWFNSLSDGEKEFIAKTTLAVAAAGPLLSIVGHLGSGMGGLIKTFGTGVSTMSNFIQLMKGGGDATKAFAEAAALASTPMADTAKGMEEVAQKASSMQMSLESAFKGAAIGMAVAFVVQQVKSVIDEIQLVSEATRNIEDISREASQAVGEVGENAEESGQHAMFLSQALSVANDALEKSAEYNKGVSDSLKEMEGNASSAQRYAETIKELGSAGNLSSQQQEQLKQAVEKYNDVTGAAVRITDAQSGKLNILVGDIDKVTEAYVRQAKTQAYTKLLDEAIEEQARREREYSKALKETDSAMHSVGTAAKTYLGALLPIINITNMTDAGNMKMALDGMKDSLEDAGYNVEYFQQKLKEAGMSTDEYNQLLSDMGIAAKNTGGDLSDMGDDAGESAQQAAKSIEEASKAAQKAMRRQHEAIYREAQRGYDAEYKAAQKAYDAEYKQLQKALDREYKEWQKSFDKVYKQRQKEFDKQYDAYKKRLDAEEDALKKSLDAKYDQRKKALDAELAQIKKANDARLKEQKKADDAETKAFKAETDRRVKALQAEYKERLRLLEMQYGGSDIDAQIKSLKDQTKAEQDEIKRRSEQEKKTELEKAVEQAKTRRKRADAEKALNDYLAELAQEQRERERDAQIEHLEQQKDALKDELQAKKDALKEEYDARIEALKAQREAELEVIKEANDAEYENLKEQLDAVYQTRKEANDAKLEQIKEANQLELDAMKEQHTVLLDNMKERHSEQLELLKEQQQEQLDQIKEGQQAQLDALKESQQEQLDAMKQAQQDALQSLKDAQEDELEALKNGGAAMVSAANVTAKGIEDTTSKTSSNVDWMVKSGSMSVIDELKSLGKSAGLQSVVAASNILNNLKPIEKQPGIYTENGMKGVNAAFVNNKPQISSNSKSAADAAERPFANLPSNIGGKGSLAMSNLATGIGQGGVTAQTQASNIATNLSNIMNRPANQSGGWGYDFMANFNNSMVSFWNNTMVHNVSSIAQNIANMFGHSTPKEGPLKGDDVWFYHMMQNLDDGLKRGTPMLMNTAYGIAEGMDDAMNNDFMDNILDGMRSKETELARQTRRMADIVTENFNPYATGNYSVGYDVKPMAQLLTNGVTEALRSGIPQRQGATIIVKEMHVRDESDIRRVSQRLYQLEAQADRRGL